MKNLLKFVLILSLTLNFSCSQASEIEDDYLDIASNYCITGEYDKAMEFLDKILKVNPENKQASDLKKGLSHVIAQDKVSFVTSVNPNVKQAQEFKRLGNEEEEYNALIKGTQSDNSYLAYYYLGDFHRAKKSYLKAIDAYNSSLSSRADFSPAYLALAVTLFDSGNYSSVLNPIDKYLSFNPEDDFAYALKARAEFQLGLVDKAEFDINRAMLINDCPEYRFEKAKILYKYGEFQDAKDLFKQLLADIQTSKIYEYLSMCDFELKNYMGALDNINKALILSDKDEYLERRYQEIKAILEGDDNEQEKDG